MQTALVMQAVRSCKNRRVPNESNVNLPKTVPQELARDGKVSVIGKIKDLNTFDNVSNGEFKIDDYLADMGNSQANWYQNSGWTYFEGYWYPPQ